MTTASNYFGSMAESYDSLIRRGVPRYDEMIARLCDYLPHTANNILELGCGTGNLSLLLTQQFPDATLTFVDAAPEMLALTRARLEATGITNRIRFIEARFEDLAIPSDRFDLVVSSISLHHVKEKGPLYHTIRALMSEHGALRFSDQLRGETAEIHAVNWQRW